MDVLQLFLRDHARVHSAAVGQPEGFSLEDVVLSGLSEDQIRLRPREGLNSLAWLLWHMARAEDVAINVVLANRPQVIDDEEWPQRLNLARRDGGTGMTDDEVSDFSAKVDIPALRGYRAAVGRRTREVAASVRPEELEQPIDAAHLRRVVSAGALGENAAWVEQLWDGKTKAWFLCWLGYGHNYMHLGEAWCVRSQAGLALPF